MKKQDIMLVAGLLLAAALCLPVYFFLGRGADSSDDVVVRIDGREWGRYSLMTDREAVFDTEFGRNVLTIKDGQAFMTEADCPDGICKAEQPITGRGQIIVCLPHRLIVEGVPSDSAASASEGMDAAAG
ncbi:MAG: NusG domain II-containing protein [Lachnospiraceae bacterium]|nr:NusG domain II-containing protein [Lachnospiraceae bacterium]